jgi:hypothetical protein
MAIAHALKPFMAACFEQGKRQLAWAERLAWAVGVVGLVVAILPASAGGLGWWLGCGSLTAMLAQRVLLHRFRERHSGGERIKRRLILAEGLGAEVSAEELADLKAEFGELASDGLPYSSSEAEPGWKRLTAIVRECAWWTGKLHRLVASRFWWWAIVTTGLFLLAVLALLFVIADQGLGGTSIAKGAAATLALLVAVDYWGRWWESREVAVECDRQVERCTAVLRSQELDPKDAVRVTLDYSGATLASYPIPSRLYGRHRERLERLWVEVERRAQ